jgi:Avidin family
MIVFNYDRWQGCNTVTSWSGQYNYSNATFQTLWYLTAAAAPAWNGINAGTDTFTPTSIAKK